MKPNKSYNYLLDYVINLQAKGRYSFSKGELYNVFDNSPEAISMAISRLIKKQRIANIRKEFYVIIPPEYLQRGILPPVLFVDDLMKFIDREYYVCLLSAAIYHGATHQQPQTFFIASHYPVIRNIKSNGIQINFLSKKEFVKEGIEKRKTDTGYINISSAELTAIDLISHCNRIGGIERAAILLEEMSENINPKKMKNIAKDYGNNSALQRLGYIFDIILDEQKLANSIKEALLDKRTINIQLSTKHKLENSSINKNWKIFVNTDIDIE